MIVGQSNTYILNSVGSRAVIGDSPNTFMGYQDNNWSNANNWTLEMVPLYYHNVVIAADCQYSVAASVTLNGLTINRGKTLTLTNNGINFTIKNTFNCMGTFNFGNAPASALILNGINNSITGSLNAATVQYQNYSGKTGSVVPYTYNNLTINYGTNVSGGAITVNGTFTVSGGSGVSFDFGSYNFNALGNTSLNGVLFCSGSPNILFAGSISTGGGCYATFNGSPTIEMRSGITVDNYNWSHRNGTLNFTTNNQTITFGNSPAISTPTVNIGAGLTIATNVPSYSGAWWYLYGPTNGLSSTSTLTNKANLMLVHSSFATTMPMATGVFNYNADPSSTLGFGYSSVNGTIPYTSFSGLYINGSSSTKTLSGDTTATGTLSVAAGALELSSFAITAGAISVQYSGASLTKNSATGLILCKGLFSCVSGGATNLTTGNPNIEIQGGISYDNGSVQLGTGNLRFTTNNQSIRSGNGFLSLYTNTTIASGVTLTNSGNLNLYTAINGEDATAKFVNASNVYLYGAINPAMATGTFDVTSNTNAVWYSGSTQTIYPINYSGLGIQNAGTKTLGGDVTVLGGFQVGTNTTTSCIMDLSSYNFTVNGQATIWSVLTKSSSTGATVFKGAVQSMSGNAGFNITQPVTVEFQNGLTINSAQMSNSFTAYFSTRNQSFLNTHSSAGNSVTGINVLVGSGVNLTIGTNSAYLYLEVDGTVNGTDATSTLTIEGIFYYGNNATLMSTGTLSIPAGVTIGYLNSTNQVFPAGTYNYGLVLGGSGTKTFSGDSTFNYSVTVTGSATLDLQSYNNYFNSTFTIPNGSTAALKKITATGATVFKGNVSITSGSSATGGLILQNNPTVEFQNGLTVNSWGFYNGGGSIYTANTMGTLLFTTNNQTFNNTGSNAENIYFGGTISIASGITLTQTTNSSSLGIKFIGGTVSGADSTSIYDVRCPVHWQNAAAPMPTGTLYLLGAANTWYYDLNGAQNILGGSYWNLYLQYNTKTLQGNVSVHNTYTLASSTTLNTNGYALTNP